MSLFLLHASASAAAALRFTSFVGWRTSDSAMCKTWGMRQCRSLTLYRLIAIHIAGGLLRAMWVFIFSAVSLTGYKIQDTSGLCQATGFFVSVGNEVTGSCTFGSRECC